MALINCEDCNQPISDQAVTCIHCGRPLVIQANSQSTNEAGLWSAVTRSKTPINLFALAMAICATFLGYAAVRIDDELALTAFTYTLHMFLAVTGMFFVTLLFARTSIYHPRDLSKYGNAFHGESKDRPMLAAFCIMVMLIGYGVYQYKTYLSGMVESTGHNSAHVADTDFNSANQTGISFEE